MYAVEMPLTLQPPMPQLFPQLKSCMFVTFAWKFSYLILERRGNWTNDGTWCYAGVSCDSGIFLQALVRFIQAREAHLQHHIAGTMLNLHMIWLVFKRICNLAVTFQKRKNSQLIHSMSLVHSQLHSTYACFYRLHSFRNNVDNKHLTFVLGSYQTQSYREFRSQIIPLTLHI